MKISNAMRTYNEAKKGYVNNHLRKELKQPMRRINALNAIESKIKHFNPELLQRSKLFIEYDRFSFANQYEEWKGSALSGAEKSVIKGLFDF